MRILFAFAAVMALTAAAPTQDWRLTTGTSSVGGLTVGNPAAKVKLTEYLSFTCSHCAHFFAESKRTLHDTLVRTGKVHVETRSVVRDPYDMAAWSVAKCGGPRRFAALAAAIFARQPQWTAKGSAWAQGNIARLQVMPKERRVRLVADHSGLSAIGARAGVTPAALTRCLANDTQINELTAMTQAAGGKISGTPNFEINGTMITEAGDWHSLEPPLRAALAR